MCWTTFADILSYVVVIIGHLRVLLPVVEGENRLLHLGVCCDCFLCMKTLCWFHCQAVAHVGPTFDQRSCDGGMMWDGWNCRDGRQDGWDDPAGSSWLWRLGLGRVGTVGMVRWSAAASQQLRAEPYRFRSCKSNPTATDSKKNKNTQKQKEELKERSWETVFKQKENENQNKNKTQLKTLQPKVLKTRKTCLLYSFSHLLLHIYFEAGYVYNMQNAYKCMLAFVCLCSVNSTGESLLGDSWTNAPLSADISSLSNAPLIWSQVSRMREPCNLTGSAEDSTGIAANHSCHMLSYCFVKCCSFNWSKSIFPALLPAVWNLVDQEWSCQFYHIASNLLNCHTSKT